MIKKIIYLLIIIFSINFVFSFPIGFDNPNLPKLEKEEVNGILNITYTNITYEGVDFSVVQNWSDDNCPSGYYAYSRYQNGTWKCREDTGGSGGDNISMHPDRDRIVKLQSKLSKKRWSDPEYHERVQENREKSMRTTKHRQLRSKIAKNLWQNPKYKEKTVSKLKQTLNTKESRDKRSNIHKELWKDPEFKQKMLNIMRSDQHRKKLSDNAKKLYKGNTCPCNFS